MMKKFLLLSVSFLCMNMLQANIQYASSVIAFSSEFSSGGWSASKALGSPDVYPMYGDYIQAWASASADGQREFITLGFANPMRVSNIAAYETLNPGAIDSVLVRDASNGQWTLVWHQTAVAKPAISRLFEVNFPLTAFQVDAVRLSLNSQLVPGWNEIDAVAIADEQVNDGADDQTGEIRLLAHFPLHGNATDLSGNDNNGSIVGNVSAAPGPEGTAGTAMYFDGQSYIEIPASASLNDVGNSMTISYWVKTESYFAGSWSSVVCKSDLGEAHYRFGLGNNNSYFAFQGMLSWNLLFPYNIQDGWAFVAAAFDGTMVRYYKNGIFVNEMELSTGGTFDANSPLYIGYDPALGIDYLIGWVSDVRIYAGALTDDQIAAVHAGGEPASTDVLVQAQQFTIYPNPASDKVNISQTRPFEHGMNSEVEIFDLSGRMIHGELLHSDQQQLDVSKLKAGSYIIKVVTGDDFYQKILIKN